MLRENNKIRCESLREMRAERRVGRPERRRRKDKHGPEQCDVARDWHSYNSAISSAAIAASAPLLALPLERAFACVMLFAVITPNPMGIL